MGSRLRGRLVEMFGADLRSLAAFRVVLASTVLIDLFGRSRNLTAHYTDAGIYPRWVVLEELGRWQFSLHLLSGTAFVQGLLFLAAGAAALALLLGWRTRLMTAVVWMLTLSVQWRNPELLNGGDMLLRVLLFWSMFLPLGAVASLDRWMGRVRPPVAPVQVSVPIVAFFLQIAFMYWFTAILKSGPEWRSEYTATYIALSAQQNVTWLGELLYPYEGLLRVITFATLWLEALGPFLLFFPFRTAAARMVGILSFVALQVGIATTMAHMGLFNWFSAAIMVAFLPREFWQWALPRVRAVPIARVPLGKRIEAMELGLARMFPAMPMTAAEPMSMPMSEGAGETGAAGPIPDISLARELEDLASAGGGNIGARGVGLARERDGDMSPHSDNAGMSLSPPMEEPASDASDGDPEPTSSRESEGGMSSGSMDAPEEMSLSQRTEDASVPDASGADSELSFMRDADGESPSDREEPPGEMPLPPRSGNGRDSEADDGDSDPSASRGAGDAASSDVASSDVENDRATLPLSMGTQGPAPSAGNGSPPPAPPARSALASRDGGSRKAPWTPQRRGRGMPRGVVSGALAAFFLVFVTLWNLATISDLRVPDSLRPIAHLTGLRQAWDMYAPRPYTSTSWVVVAAELDDGTEVDLLASVLHSDVERARPVSWDRPADLPAVFKDKYWSTFLGRLGGSSEEVRLAFARWICREWNAEFADTSSELIRFDIVQVVEETQPGYNKAPPRYRDLWWHRCR